MSPRLIDSLLPPRVYGVGLCIPSSMTVRLEFRRVAHELRGPGCSYGWPAGYVEQHHARQRYALFALMWAAIGAQMTVEDEVPG